MLKLMREISCLRIALIALTSISGSGSPATFEIDARQLKSKSRVLVDIISQNEQSESNMGEPLMVSV